MMNEYRAYAQGVAQRYGIPAELFFNLVTQESSWNPQAVSPKGAVGLTQLMPGTAGDLGVDPTDWRQNLEGGARYLKQQFDRFQSWPRALAAYNAGPRRVAESGGIPNIKETRNYVSKILGGYAGGNEVAQDTMAALGRGGAGMTPQAMQGLLAQDAAATARPIPAQPQAPARDYGNLLDTLAIGFSGLSMRPNEALIGLAQERIKRRRETAQRNATADWLESQGMTQQAEAVRRGVLSGSEALTMVRGGEATAAQRNYEFLIGQGVDPETAMQRAFAGGTTINMPGAGGMSEEGYKAIVKREAAVSEAGMNAQRNLGLVNALEAQLAQAPQGAGGVFLSAAGNLGLEFDGTSAVQAADALISQLVPAQRPPGSGQMSDADLALFKRSLPRLINTPEGNRRIIETMREMLNYDIQRGQIADQVLLGTMTPQEANQAYMELGNPLGWLREGIGQDRQAEPGASPDGASNGIQWRLVD